MYSVRCEGVRMMADSIHWYIHLHGNRSFPGLFQCPVYTLQKWRGKAWEYLSHVTSRSTCTCKLKSLVASWLHFLCPEQLPYSRKYWRSLNLEVWSRAAEIKILADLNLAVVLYI